MQQGLVDDTALCGAAQHQAATVVVAKAPARLLLGYTAATDEWEVVSVGEWPL
jgi:hypothetical protein